MQLNYYVLGQRIQKIRKNKRISQAVLSTMIDKSAGYISYLECGTKVMSLETFVGIANALEVSTDTLLNRQLTGATEMSKHQQLHCLQEGTVSCSCASAPQGNCHLGELRMGAHQHMGLALLYALR